MVWESSALHSAQGSFSLLPVLSVGGNTAETIEGISFIKSGNPWLDGGTPLTAGRR